MPLTSDRARLEPPRGAAAPGQSPNLGKTVLHDLRRGGLHRSLRQDLRDLHDFYLDDARRARLDGMGPLPRWFFRLFWLLEQLFLKLSPVRRILLLVAFVLSFQAGSFDRGGTSVEIRGSSIAFILVLVVLMLELKDKLLARQEIEVGRAVQNALLPETHPTLAGWEFWLFTRPANDVGGDLVDYLFTSEDRLGVALGDVAGKGLGAALLMAKLQATLRAFAPDSAPLDALGARMNTILCRDSPATRFATLVYFEAEPHSGKVRLLNAGHPQPVVVRAQSIEQLPPAALPLGILPTATYVEQHVDLEPGALLLVYSDGVTEAENRAGDLFGDERLLSLARQLHGLPAEAAGARILAEVARFAGDRRPSDDLSLVLARRTSTG